MPDHVHVLFVLGSSLTLSQVWSKFKSLTKRSLGSVGLTWQTNFYDHRLRSDVSIETFARYVFLNPYRKGLLDLNEVWPWWVLNREYPPEFLELLGERKVPPREWLGLASGLETLLQEECTKDFE
jgi:hypothetical protein